MGMNLKNITHSINLGIPDTCDALVQQNGRAGRALESESCGWTYVEPSVMTALGSRTSDNTEQEDYREVCSDSEVHVPPSTKNTKGKAKAAKQSKSKPPMQRMTTGGNLDSKLMWLLGAHEQGHCLKATKNAIFSCPGEHTKKRCQEAGRPLPCSSCQPFWNNPSPAPMPTDFSLPPPAPTLPNNYQDSA
jgi:superfamily II DNA/RNA helicase